MKKRHTIHYKGFPKNFKLKELSETNKQTNKESQGQ